MAAGRQALHTATTKKSNKIQIIPYVGLGVPSFLRKGGERDFYTPILFIHIAVTMVVVVSYYSTTHCSRNIFSIMRGR